MLVEVSTTLRCPHASTAAGGCRCHRVRLCRAGGLGTPSLTWRLDRLQGRPSEVDAELESQIAVRDWPAQRRHLGGSEFRAAEPMLAVGDVSHYR